MKPPRSVSLLFVLLSPIWLIPMLVIAVAYAVWVGMADVIRERE